MILTAAFYIKHISPGQVGEKIVNDIFKCIFVNENVSTLIKISLYIVPNGSIDRKSALVYVMAITCTNANQVHWGMSKLTFLWDESQHILYRYVSSEEWT